MIGFKIDEVMTGTHEFVDNPTPKKMEFKATWGAQNILDVLANGYIRFGLSGKIDIEGFCENATIMGNISIDYFIKNKIIYNFMIHDQDEMYLFHGEKVNIKPWNLLTSHTTCFGTLTDIYGDLISRSVTHFKLGSLFSFLKSFRLII